MKQLSAARFRTGVLAPVLRAHHLRHEFDAEAFCADVAIHALGRFA